MVKTSQVLAGAYVNLDKCLSHAVEYGADGWAVRVLCKSVKFESIAAEHMDDATDESPTCKTCAKRDPRNHATV
jgi:hypothetical protein